MGATELTWRAGTDVGVTAADSGRDLEAVFSSPGEDGSTAETRYWIEAKGRSGTVPKIAVTTAINDLTAHPEVDVFVFCTNSRFSNPTRDWVTKWQASHSKPEIRLWDRDHLARLVRDHPTVAARTLPEALDDTDRLKLLLERFEQLGETPTSVDLDYYWGRRAVVAESGSVVEVVAMFAYTEGHDDLAARPWSVLLPTDEMAAAETILYASLELPKMLMRDLARPLHGPKTLETSAYLVLASLPWVGSELAHRLLTSPATLVDGDPFLSDEAFYPIWMEHIVRPIWGRMRDELRDTCATDCIRVSTEPHAFPAALVGDQYWRRFGVGAADENRFLTIENLEEPCLVGLPLNAMRTCPLVAGDNEEEAAGIDVSEVDALRTIVGVRREHPDGLSRAYRQSRSTEHS